jgi:hypothetical protein
MDHVLEPQVTAGPDHFLRVLSEWVAWCSQHDFRLVDATHADIESFARYVAQRQPVEAAKVEKELEMTLASLVQSG